MQEREIKFLDIDVADLEKKLQAIGAQKQYDEVFEEWIFVKAEWKTKRGRVRVRKGNGKVELAYKETTKGTGQGNIEIEFGITDAKKAKAFIEKMGLENIRHQQKRRLHYIFKGVEIDIDFWPMIPAYVEIEGENLEQLEAVATQLGFDLTKKVELDAVQIYKDIYGIDVGAVKNLTF